VTWPLLTLLLPLVVGPAAPQHENQVAAEWRLQRGRLAEACAPRAAALFKCPAELITDHPIHLAVGSLAPQNGFAAGPAFVTHRLREAYDMSWNADAVWAPNGSWRSGLYFKVVLTRVPDTTTVPIDSADASDADVSIRPYPVIDAYVQGTSLQTVHFFGLGPGSSKADQTVFGMRETVAGTRLIYPFRRLRALNVSALGELNGRFVDLREGTPGTVPPLEQVYSETTAPGVANQPAFAQFGEGVRIKPRAFKERLRFNYLLAAEQFVARSDASYSFRRWTADLDHEFSFYRTVMGSERRDTHGPNDCAAGLGDSPCPPLSISRNRYGSFGLRLLASTSSAGDTGAVPFYFQRTLGGSDINGERRLSAYEDYRFRGPAMFSIRESLEHYIYGVVGVSITAEQGTVSSPNTRLDLSHLKHSVAAGLSLRAGGLPLAHLLWAWGPEGHRIIAVVSTSLLGGSGRPALD
jgi:hypothetical protein